MSSKSSRFRDGYLFANCLMFDRFPDAIFLMFCANAPDFSILTSAQPFLNVTIYNQFNKLTSVFHASLRLLIMTFIDHGVALSGF